MIDTIHLSFFYQNSDLLFVQYPSFFPHQLYNPYLLFIMIDTIHPSFLSKFYSSICPTPIFFLQNPIHYCLSFFHHQCHNPNLLFNIIGSLPPSFLSEFYSSIYPTPIFFFIISFTFLIYYST